jgi:hypothetical protein
MDIKRIASQPSGTGLVVGHSSSGAEELAKKIRETEKEIS